MVTEVGDLNSDGTNKFGAAGSDLGQLITATPGSAASTWSTGPNFAAYAAANPQGTSSLGTNPGESPTDVLGRQTTGRLCHYRRQAGESGTCLLYTSNHRQWLEEGTLGS